MKQFPTFLSAIEYHKNCVICNSKMDINDRDLATDIGYEFRENKLRVSFYLSGNHDDIITINPYTDEVELSLANNAQTHYSPNYAISGGQFYHGLTLHCKTCCQFAYTLQVKVDLAASKLIGTFLNSETLSIESSEMIHEIKNIYATDKTEYAYFPKDGTTKKVVLPLVPLNLINPQETIDRLRKLLIFS